MCQRYQKNAQGFTKLNKRAAIGVYAHASDLKFIQQMYTSLLLQLQSMMALDEKNYDPSMCANCNVKMESMSDESKWYCTYCGELTAQKRGKNGVPNSWRVSYGFGWVDTIQWRLWEAYRKNAAEAEVRTPGSELVVRDKQAAVDKFMDEKFTGKASRMAPRQDGDASGRHAGAKAARRADLGQTRVTDGARPQLGA